MTEKNIIITPFVNLGNVEDEYFSDGVTDELLFALTKVSGIKVASRTSTYFLKNKNLSILEIGEISGADYILEGSVRKIENVARIAVQLVKIDNEVSLFSEIYETELNNIFKIQSNLASKIAEKLKGTFDNFSYSVSFTKNSKAHELYLKGNYHWYRYTKEEIELAISYFNKAIKLEPEFALAYSGLAKSYAVLGAVGFSNPNDVFPKAKDAAKKALLINNKLVEPHLSSAWVSLFYDRDLAATKRHLDQCLRLNPNKAAVYDGYSRYYTVRGSLKKAEQECLRSIEIDPLELTYHANLFRIYYYLGRFDEALSVCEGALEINPSFFPAIEQKGWIYVFLGELEKAIETFLDFKTKTNSSIKSLAGLGYAYARSGFAKESNGCLRQIIDYLREQIDANRKHEIGLISFDLAIINIGLRNNDDAYKHIKKCIDNRLGIIAYELLCNPVFHQLKSEERFRELFGKSILSKRLFPQELSDESNFSVITISSDTKEKLLLDPNDILFIKADNNYSIIYWKEGNELKNKVMRITLSKLEKQLKPFPFITRCHKSFMINVKENYSISGNSRGYKFKSLFSPTAIPVSRLKGRNVLSLHRKYHAMSV